MDSVEIETGSVELMIQNLHEATEECLESGDYLSLSTILDIYLTKSLNFKIEDKESFLSELYIILSENHDLVYEIGWDLPPLLIELIKSQWNFVSALRDVKGLVTIMNIFDLLATYGNPKELLLIACELFSQLKADSNEKDEEYIQHLIDEDEDIEVINYFRVRAYRAYLIIFHCLIEMTTISLKRNTTLYPSKFLSMVVSALRNFMSLMDKSTNLMPVIRRLYLFVRDYQPPNLPKDKPDDYSLENYRDEEYLQRKLLACLFGIVVKESTFHVGHNFCKYILEGGDNHPPSSTDNDDNELGGEERKVTEFFLGDHECEFMDRFISLGYSIDFDYEELFLEELNSKVQFIDSIKLEDIQDNNLIELIVNDYESKSKDLKSLPILIDTKILLYTKCFLFGKDQKLLKSELPKFEEIMKLALYYITAISIKVSRNPSVREGSALLSAFMVLIYHSVDDPQLAPIVLTEKSEIYIKTLLQSMLFTLGLLLDILSLNSLIKKMFYTLVVKIFSNIILNNDDNDRGEIFVEKFLIDSIANCPITEFQLNFVQILKDFIMLARPSGNSRYLDLNKNNMSYEIVNLIEEATTINTNTQLTELEISKLLSLTNLSGTLLRIVDDECKSDINNLMYSLKMRISKLGKDETNIPLELLKFNVDTVIDVSSFIVN